LEEAMSGTIGIQDEGERMPAMRGGKLDTHSSRLRQIWGILKARL
jgi:hypothetical protein